MPDGREQPRPGTPGLRLVAPERADEGLTLFINGWETTLHVWTVREFALLKQKPADAVRFHEVWVALRVSDRPPSRQR